MFSNALNLCSSLNVRNKVWHPQKTTNLGFVYFHLSAFREEMERQRFWTEWYQLNCVYGLYPSSRWWIKSINTIRLILKHHRQNPTEVMNGIKHFQNLTWFLYKYIHITVCIFLYMENNLLRTCSYIRTMN
jgi:hypothetical protein